jgi:transposase
MIIKHTHQGWSLVGSGGQLLVPEGDDITIKIAMLYEAECEDASIKAITQKFGYSKQRYYQLLHLFQEKGAVALHNQKPGPKSNYRRTDENVRQVIRHRFLDPDASAEVIAQKMRQAQIPMSTRSVERVIQEYGLQKKTL